MKISHTLAFTTALLLTGCAPAAPSSETSSPASSATSGTPSESPTTIPTAITEPIEFLSLKTGEAKGTIQILTYEPSQCGNPNLAKITFEVAITSPSFFFYQPRLWQAYKDEENVVPDGGYNSAAMICAQELGEPIESAALGTGDSRKLNIILDITDAKNVGIRMEDDVQLLTFGL